MWTVESADGEWIVRWRLGGLGRVGRRRRLCRWSWGCDASVAYGPLWAPAGLHVRQKETNSIQTVQVDSHSRTCARGPLGPLQMRVSEVLLQHSNQWSRVESKIKETSHRFPAGGPFLRGFRMRGAGKNIRFQVISRLRPRTTHLVRPPNTSDRTRQTMTRWTPVSTRVSILPHGYLVF